VKTSRKLSNQKPIKKDRKYQYNHIQFSFNYYMETCKHHPKDVTLERMNESKLKQPSVTKHPRLFF